MKTLKFLVAAALFAVSTSAIAQEQEAKYEFKNHWYLQLQGGAQYTLGEAKFKDLISGNVQAALGYQFNPWLGARLSVNAWQSKGGYNGYVTPGMEAYGQPGNVIYKFKYVAPSLDVMFNLSNAIWGYNPMRTVNLTAFAGVGANVGINNDEANDIYNQGYEMAYIWDGTKVRATGRAGVAVDFRLSDYVSLGIEANANVLSDHYNSKKAGNADWYFNALAGVKFNLGKSYKKVVPVAPVVAKPVEQPAPQPAPKKVETPKPQPAPVVKKVEPLRRDVFFELNSYVIRESEAKKIAEIAEYMKANGNVKLTITGYADVQTGNEKINEGLSKNRSEVVAKELVEKYGIAADRIQTAYKGDTVQPFSVNEQNRVAVCITEAK